MHSSSKIGLQGVIEYWAKWSARAFRFKYPAIDAILYEVQSHYVLVVPQGINDFASISKIFDNEISITGCPIELADSVPSNAVLVDELSTYEKELWLVGEPISVTSVNRVISLIAPNLPSGIADYDRTLGGWKFESENVLTDLETQAVSAAMTQAGMTGNIFFEQKAIPPSDQKSHPSKSLPINLVDLVTAREMESTLPAVFRPLVQKDEDEWRDFINSRAAQESFTFETSPQRDGFCCLFDAADKSEIRLAELLTIYDQIDLVPDRNSNWLVTHGLTLKDLQELVQLQRIRLVLPFSAHLYRPDIISAVAEVDSKSIVMSRSLAAKTILHNQTKDPLMYAPLTYNQRAGILSILAKNLPGGWFEGLITSYGRLFNEQHSAFMMRGANASLGHGVGAHISEVFQHLHKGNASLDLMITGASIEWSLGLGASYIPRGYGSGHDETNTSLLIASYLGRTPFKPADPVVDRMHSIVDGLLVVSKTPPIEVARNFHSSSTTRFKKVAMNLMKETNCVSELQALVTELNKDVTTFERRSERLAKFRLDTLFTGIAAKPIADAIDLSLGNFASPVAAWLYALLKDKLPESIQCDLADAGSIITGLATASSLDAVIVSRSRKALN